MKACGKRSGPSSLVAPVAVDEDVGEGRGRVADVGLAREASAGSCRIRLLMVLG